MKKSSEKLLDKQIEAAQEENHILMMKLKASDVKLKKLFEKRYPNGRYHDSFKKGVAVIFLALMSSVALASDVEPKPMAEPEPREDAQLAHVHRDNCCSLDQRIDVASIEPNSESLIGKSTAVIDHYYTNEQAKNHLIDSIYGVPGVVTKDITGLGSVRVRGARSFDTKYLYDGFPMRDPSHPQNSFGSFFGDTLSLGQSEIQFLKGSGSVLYGSEAIGGVVDIVPQPTDGVESTTEYGSHNSFMQKVDSGPVTLAYLDSRSEETVNLRVSHDFGQVEPFLIYQETEAPLHSAPFVLDRVYSDMRDENDRREVRYFQAGVKTEGYVNTKLSYSNSDRRFVFLPNSDGTGFWNDGTFGSESVFLDVNSKVFDTTIGYSHTHDFMTIESEGLDTDSTDLYQNDLYAEHELWIGDIYLLLGARHSIHEFSKDRTVYDASASYNLDGYILRAHYGTGFRAPSLYELHGAFLTSFGRFEIGNGDLSPERSDSLDFGIEKTWDERITTGLTVFQHSLTNRIDFTNQYVNVDGTLDTWGYEAFYEQFLFGNTSARVAYTRTVQPGLLDVSPHSIEASIRTVRKDWSVVAQLGYRDEHEVTLFDMNTFMLSKVPEDGYFSSSVTAQYSVMDNVIAYVRVENLLDEEYYDGGYRKDGLAAYAGVKVSI